VPSQIVRHFTFIFLFLNMVAGGFVFLLRYFDGLNKRLLLSGMLPVYSHFDCSLEGSDNIAKIQPAACFLLIY
jgi:hypothetical protein